LAHMDAMQPVASVGYRVVNQISLKLSNPYVTTYIYAYVTTYIDAFSPTLLHPSSRSVSLGHREHWALVKK